MVMGYEASSCAALQIPDRLPRTQKGLTGTEMQEIDQTRYRLAQGLLSVDTGDENFLLSTNAGKYFGVKGAMRYLLEDMREGLSFDEMVTLTCNRYKVTKDEAERDLGDMLDKVVAAGIVERTGPQ